MSVTGPAAEVEHEVRGNSKVESASPLPTSTPNLSEPRPFLRWVVWLPIPVVLVTLAFLWMVRPSATYNDPQLLFGANVAFQTVTSCVVAYLTARSFLVYGTPGLLLLGCGVLLWGTAGAISNIAYPRSANLQITVYNLAVLLSAVSQFAGTVMYLNSRRRLRHTGMWVSAGYICAVGAVSVLTICAPASWMPQFFVEGQGGTPVRQVVLGSAITFLAATSVLLWNMHDKSSSRFLLWYGPGTGLVALGLFGVLLQFEFGDPLNWTGRVTQWAGGVYMMIAAIGSARESGAWAVSLEAQLEQTKQDYHRLMELAADGIVVHEIDKNAVYGPFVQANQAFCRLVGYSSAELYAMSPKDVVVEEQRQAVTADAQVLGRLGQLRHEKTLERKDGTRVTCEISTQVFEREGRGLVMSIVRDVSERKRAEALLQRNNEQLEHIVAERTGKLTEMVSELQQVSYAIVHDMRAPLRTMIGFAQSLCELPPGALQGPEAKDYCDRIMRGSLRLDKLITDALRYTKAVLLEIPMEPVPLTPLVRGLLETYPNLSPDKAEIILQDELPAVIGNESLLTQCFSNLLGNAVKFVAPGKRPRVIIRVEHPPEALMRNDRQLGEAQAGTRSARPLVKIWVEDNGVGISETAQKRLFGMFEKLDSTFEGTGIGLAIVRKVVERMGGRVGAESSPGKGSRFWVELRNASM